MSIATMWTQLQRPRLLCWFLVVLVLETTAATVSWVDLTGAWNVFNAAKGDDVITFIVYLIVHSPVGKLV